MLSCLIQRVYHGDTERTEVHGEKENGGEDRRSGLRIGFKPDPMDIGQASPLSQAGFGLSVG